jgi:hypothetical protein
MSHFIRCGLSTIAYATIGLIAIGSNPATARESVAMQDAPTASLGQGLNIGLQPIIPTDTTKSRVAIQQSTTSNPRQPLGLGVTARVGTLGIGLDVAKSLSPQFDARLGFNFGNVGFNRNDSGINYDSQLNLSSVQLFGDYYLFGGNSFRITGGLVAQNNRFSVTSRPSGSGTYTIDNQSFSASQVGNLTGEFKYANSIAPYLGIGLGHSTNEGFGFNADLGIMFTGAPKVTLNASNPAFNNDPTTRGAIDNQIRQTENDLRGFNIYPVLSIGVSYGF